ncbi:helix-turn-helix transcriptional regulator [Ligilactobacillus agilis]|uniref:helix-turn-helix transcriptional regulator n=2 Tax=Ligilactobacillus agilis TaxID=1601 RepID=UPI00242FC0F2|nr:sigma factor-like helix-turn-helix DNA-binding protein [Ligilactobacillus agilis]
MVKTNVIGLTRADIIARLDSEFGFDWTYKAPYDHKYLQMLRLFPEITLTTKPFKAESKQAECIKLYYQGLSFEEIAEIQGSSVRTVHRYLSKIIEVKHKNTKHYLKVYNADGKLIAEGSANQVASQLRVTWATAMSHVKSGKPDAHGYTYKEVPRT